MNPLAWKWQATVTLALVAIACFSTWKVDAWRYGEQLAKQASQHQADLSAISNAGAALLMAEQEKRQDLEQAPAGQ